MLRSRAAFSAISRISAVRERNWARDVSDSIAAKVQEVAQHKCLDLTAGTRAFIEAHTEPVGNQQMLPLW